jgi:hypothetical protein
MAQGASFYVPALPLALIHERPRSGLPGTLSYPLATPTNSKNPPSGDVGGLYVLYQRNVKNVMTTIANKIVGQYKTSTHMLS